MTKAWNGVVIILVAACGSPNTSAPRGAAGESPITQAASPGTRDSTIAPRSMQVGDSAGAPLAVISRDSAGIKIVETSVPAWGGAARWRVDAGPSLSIGETDGAEPYLFFRIAGAVRRKNGSIVVADGETRELRAFDSAGRFSGAKGRRGQGPAEFTGIGRIARCGPDELWIDARTRISVWSLELEYRREFVVTDNIMWPLVCFGGTGLLVKRDVGSDAEPPERTLYVDTLNLMVVDSVGKDRHDLRKIPLYSRLDVVSKGTRYGIVHPFAPVTVLAAAGPNVVMGSGERLEVLTYSRSGKLLRIARGPVENLALTSTVRRDYQAAELSGWPKQERELLEQAGNPMPKTIPAYTALLVDSEGNTWAKRFSPPGQLGNRWGVFGRDGEFLGHMVLPKELKVFEIGADYILGSVRDSLYVEQVRLYRLHR